MQRSILDMNAFSGEAGDNALLARRMANAGSASVLFYREPITMSRAERCWMEDAAGRRYLDFYNNVPSIGHCHPAVVEAVSAQMARLNVHSRYLSETVEAYTEALKATMPVGLTNVVLTCSGSEANDLALRVAKAVTGRCGVIVTRHAYHGNTAAVSAVSPASWKHHSHAEHVRVVEAPSRLAYREEVEQGFAEAVREAIASLEAAGHGASALLVDSIFSSDGIYVEPPGFLGAAVAAVHAAGGLFIADEVQPGFGRLGGSMDGSIWGFATHRVRPDIVTMGKPMGNGFPMAGLITRPECLAAFTRNTGYFNTFGGNPVAAAAGQAVLHVLQTEGLVANAARQGQILLDALTDRANRHSLLKDARGRGLFLGLEIRDGAAASRLVNELRDEGVLIGTTGAQGETLKLRPPLCLSDTDRAFFLDALDRALTRLE